MVILHEIYNKKEHESALYYNYYQMITTVESWSVRSLFVKSVHRITHQTLDLLSYWIYYSFDPVTNKPGPKVDATVSNTRLDFLRNFWADCLIHINLSGQTATKILRQDVSLLNGTCLLMRLSQTIPGMFTISYTSNFYSFDKNDYAKFMSNATVYHTRYNVTDGCLELKKSDNTVNLVEKPEMFLNAFHKALFPLQNYANCSVTYIKCSNANFTTTANCNDVN